MKLQRLALLSVTAVAVEAMARAMSAGVAIGCASRYSATAPAST